MFRFANPPLSKIPLPHLISRPRMLLLVLDKAIRPKNDQVAGIEIALSRPASSFAPLGLSPVRDRNS
jgi:hypothetical protein